MKKAIYTIVESSLERSIISLASSLKVNSSYPHIIFYHNTNEEVTEDVRSRYKMFEWVEIEQIELVESNSKDSARYIDYTGYSSAILYTIGYLRQYEHIIYISEHTHIISPFDITFEEGITLYAPQLSRPIDTSFVTNAFKEANNITTSVYISPNILVFNPSQILAASHVDKFNLFARQLYYQNRLEIGNQSSVVRIPLTVVLNLYASIVPTFKYLPPNYLLDVEYTSDYEGEVVAVLIDADLNFNKRLDEQPEFTSIDYHHNVYHLEYLLIVMSFIRELPFANKWVIDQNTQYINQQIIARNKIYQERLNR